MTKIIQMKISLDGIKPEIWRRFAVEDSISFGQLHETIQKVMGWENYHLYEFKINGKSIIPPEEGYNPAEASFHTLFNSPDFKKMLESQDLSKGSASLDVAKLNKILKNKKKDIKDKVSIETPINDFINKEGMSFKYTYDFGDSWEHSILVEKITEKDSSEKYPVCLGGERACPPEDCGSVDGYEELMKIRRDKKHPEYKEKIVGWLGKDYDPKLFVVDWVNARLSGKKPKSVWMPKKDDFVPLGELLDEDNDAVKEIKSTFDREWEYEDYLGEIEYRIANYFLNDRTLKDKDVEKAIKNIKKNYNEDIDFFKDKLEKEIMLGLSLALQDESITHHELRLVFNYILWSIDNRSWMNDNQAFVKWLPCFFDLYDEKEMKKYKQNFTKKARRMGIPQDKIDAMLNEEGAEVSKEDKKFSAKQSELFSLEDDKKFDFVVEHGIKNPYLVQSYIIELDEKEDFATIEKLCKKMMELSNNFPMFEFLLGLNYHSMEMPQLAEHHMKNAVKTLENAPPDWISDEEKEKMLAEMKEPIKRMGIK